MRLRAISVSNDDLEAYLDEARRTQINYSYVALDDDNLANLMIIEYESLLLKYKEQKRGLMQLSKQKSERGNTQRNSASIEKDYFDDRKLREKLEESLDKAKNMIEQLSFADSF